MRILRRLAFDAFHHIRHGHDRGIVTGRRGEHAFIGGARYAVPLVEAAVLGIAAFAVAQMPFAEASSRIALAGDQLRQRDFPRDQALRQAGRHRLQRAGAYRVAAGHQRRARRHAIGFDVEVEKTQPLGRKVIEPGRRRAAQFAAAITAEFAPAEIVGEDEHDVRLAHGSRSGHVYFREAVKSS